MPVTVAHTTRSRPSLPYTKVAAEILGAEYKLTVVVCGVARARALNQTTRGKTYTPDVLAFPFDEHHGEIYLCPAAAKRHTASFGHTAFQHLLFLYIHACLHLAGYTHGPRMEARERAYLARFAAHKS